MSRVDDLVEELIDLLAPPDQTLPDPENEDLMTPAILSEIAQKVTADPKV